MRLSVVLLAAAAALTSSVALAGPDYPHRDWGKVATLDMSLTDATTCIARTLNKRGSVLVLPVDGGNDIDFSVGVAWGNQPDPWERFKLREEEGVTTLRVFYRHPIRRGGVDKDVKRLQKHCLKISRIEATSTQDS